MDLQQNEASSSVLQSHRMAYPKRVLFAPERSDDTGAVNMPLNEVAAHSMRRSHRALKIHNRVRDRDRICAGPLPLRNNRLETTEAGSPQGLRRQPDHKELLVQVEFSDSEADAVHSDRVAKLDALQHDRRSNLEDPLLGRLVLIEREHNSCKTADERRWTTSTHTHQFLPRGQ